LQPLGEILGVVFFYTYSIGDLSMSVKSFRNFIKSTENESVELDEMENAQYEIRDIMKKLGIRGTIGSGRTVKVGNSHDAKKLKAALKKHKPGRGAENIKSYKVVSESVEMNEAWTADSVIKNAEIGSKKGYGINIKKTGGVTKTPFKHMLMTMRRDKSIRVTFDYGKDEFEGTPQSVAIYLNRLLGIKESVELDEASPKIKYAKIVKGIRDSQGPFSVVAIKNGKVVAQKNSIKNSKMLPIEVNDMADAHPGATISIESKGGEILNTFKESVELDEALVLASDNRRDVEKTAKKLAKQSPNRTYYVVRNLETYMDRYEVVDSVDMHMYKKSKKVVGYGKDVKESVDELYEDYKEMMKWYKTSNEKKVYAILKKNNIKLPAEGFTLVQNMLKKHRDNVKKAADEIMNKHYPHLKESVELDEYLRKDVYAIANKKGKVVAANLIKKNAHKEILRHRGGTIVLDPDAKAGNVLKKFAKESVELDESHMIGKTVIVAGMKGKVTKQIGKDGETESDEIYRVRFEDGSVKDIPARDMEIQNDKPGENEAEDIVNIESVARRSRIFNYFKKK
jgi:hypothetical protein